MTCFFDSRDMRLFDRLAEPILSVELNRHVLKKIHQSRSRDCKSIENLFEELGEQARDSKKNLIGVQPTETTQAAPTAAPRTPAPVQKIE